MSEEMNTIVSKGATIEEAVGEALLHLGARRDEVDIKVIEEGKNGLFGVFGRKQACVEVTKRERRRRRRGGRGRGRQGEDDRDGRNEENQAKSDQRNETPHRAAATTDDQGSPEEGRRRTRGGRGRGGRGRGPRRDDDAPSNESRREEQRADSPPTTERTEAPQAARQTREPRERRPRQERHPRTEEPREEPQADRTAARPPQASDGRRERRPRPTREERAVSAVMAQAEDTTKVERARPVAAPKENTMNLPPLGEPVAVAEGTPRIAGATVESATEHVQAVTEELLKRCGFMGRVAVNKDNESDYLQVRCIVDMNSIDAMVGRRSSAITAIQHLVDRLVTRSVGEHVPINMDINNYRQRQDGQLTTMARGAMARVTAGGDDDHLPSMNARERRVIHMEVAEIDELATYTKGTGMDRHVVITSKLGDNTPASDPDEERRR